jgi:AcrR family transcriptional regulator
VTATYHHGNLRAGLVEAGVELARTSGPAGVVLREVARRTGVSHNAAYRHFADRDDLLAEIAQVAMDRLSASMQARLDAVTETDPLLRADERLRATGRGYVAFALEETGLFEVAFAAPAGDDGKHAVDERSAGPFEVLVAALDEGVRAGAVAPERRDGAEVLCWSAVHGFALLHARGPLAGIPAAERDATLEAMLDGITRSLR